jgi:hypothetical protein
MLRGKIWFTASCPVLIIGYRAQDAAPTTLLSLVLVAGYASACRPTDHYMSEEASNSGRIRMESQRLKAEVSAYHARVNG